MKYLLLIILSVAAFQYQIEYVNAENTTMPVMPAIPGGDIMEKLAPCLSMHSIQKSTIDCQRELYKSLADDPNKNCSAAAATMLPSCLNSTTVKCVLNALNMTIDMLPPGVIPSSQSPFPDPKLFCENIVPIMMEPLQNCSVGFYMAQAMCVTPFQRKFRADRADSGLCDAYSVQMNCIKSAMMADCDAEEAQNMTMKYPFLFEKAGNPFCSVGDNGDGGDNGNSSSHLIGQSILIALCICLMKLLV